ncbi:MAG: hypothetical protein QOF51_3462 [Chloroflexota bacterium]|jgi:hypothetical protein|nr:hypothetical protein [Chloroflexota bacterium]
MGLAGRRPCFGNAFEVTGIEGEDGPTLTCCVCKLLLIAYAQEGHLVRADDIVPVRAED